MRKPITYKELTTQEKGELEALCDSIYKLQERCLQNHGWKWARNSSLGRKPEVKLI